MAITSKIAFVGLTHLGLNHLAATAKKGYKVMGFDLDKNKIELLNEFSIKYEEKNLKNTLKNCKKKISFTSNFKKLKNFKIIYICPDVKTDKLGKSDTTYLKKLISLTLRFSNKNSVIVLLSQVNPGFTRNIKFNHKRLYYQVETLVFGKALERALKPERIIIGCKNSKIKINKDFYKYLKKFNCPIIKMKYESAELTKISINILLASSITTANVLAKICTHLGADWYEIMPALRLDKRIGNKAYIKPGLGISGGNIERDIYTTEQILKKYSNNTEIIKSFKKNSYEMKMWVYKILKKEKIILNKKKFILGILGLSYKEHTDSTKNSPTINLLNKIRKNKINIYDPKAKLNKKIKNIVQYNNIKKIIRFSNVIILMTPWPEFTKVNSMLKNIRKKIVLIDPHRIINKDVADLNTIKYFTIGK